MSAFNVAVFASGNGTNFQELIDRVEAGTLDVRLALLVCDKPQATAIERAKRANIPTFVFRPKQYASREAYEQEILDVLNRLHIDLIVLAGYMRLITPVLVEPFAGRIINVHPSLLPAFPGVRSAAQALDYGVKVTGVTVHFVDVGLDTGPVIAQQAVPVRDDDTEETLLERIHEVERELLPAAVSWIREGRLELRGRKVIKKGGQS